MALLRGSGEHTGDAYDFAAIAGTNTGDGGVPHGRLLIAFAEAALGRDGERLAAARDALVATMGAAALVDSAAVVAIFESAVRIADATGIPLEEPKAAQTAAIRAELGIDDYPHARAQ